MWAVHWQVHGSLDFESAFILVCDTCGDIIDDSAQVFANSSVFFFVEDDDSWTLGDISLSRNEGVYTSLCADSTAIQMLCGDFSLVVSNKASAEFRMALPGLDAVQDSSEIRKRVTALKSSGAMHLAKIDAFGSHVCERASRAEVST